LLLSNAKSLFPQYIKFSSNAFPSEINIVKIGKKSSRILFGLV